MNVSCTVFEDYIYGFCTVFNDHIYGFRTVFDHHIDGFVLFLMITPMGFVLFSMITFMGFVLFWIITSMGIDCTVYIYIITSMDLLYSFFLFSSFHQHHHRYRHWEITKRRSKYRQHFALYVLHLSSESQPVACHTCVPNNTGRRLLL